MAYMWCAGKFGYYLTFVLQWLNLLCANVGLVVLAGESLKVIIKHLNGPNVMQCYSVSCDRRPGELQRFT